MTTITVDLYTALIEAGVDKEKARKVADQIVMRDELNELATRSDLRAENRELEIRLQRFIFTALVTQAVFVIGLVAGMIKLL